MENNAFSPEQADAIKSILGNREGEEYVKIALPSNGLEYSKEVEIRPFTFADEKFALKHDVKKSDFMNVLMSRCIKEVDIDSLFICDKAFLIQKLKEISTGPEINMNIECEACDTENSLTIDLRLLNIKEVPEGTEYPFTFRLGVLDKDIVVRPGKVRDEAQMASFELLSNNLWRYIESINEVDDKTVISEVVPKLPVEDVHQIMKKVSMSDYGVESSFFYVCTTCGNKQETEVPLTANFFGTA